MGDHDFRALVEHAPDAIVVSRAGMVLYANAAAARLLGHDDVSELVGKPMTFLDRRSVEVMRRRIEQMASTGEHLVPREYPARRRDGSEIVAEIASTMIAFEGGPAVLAYARDVTERSRLRAQLAHVDRLASLGKMAAGVAHEINNPLTFVALAADVLAGRASPADSKLVDEIKVGAARIAAIVRDLRFFGRYEDEPLGSVDLASAIAAAERLVSHELRPRGVLLKEYEALPAVVGVGRHVEQVFVNLFLNAAHALGEGSGGKVVVRAVVTESHVVVSVADDGCGMDKALLDVVFEPYVTTRGAEGGTGLGLSICRDLISRGGGDLSARSAVGQGTTMELTFRRAVAPEPPAPSTRPAAASAETDPVASPTKLRVLVVDDEPSIVRALSTILSRRATVVGETAAERALQRILEGPPFDAIVCDVMMPGMTGIDLHERVARARPGVEARFIFITGGVYTTRERDYLERMPNVHLAKPFEAAKLIAEIERVARG